MFICHIARRRLILWKLVLDLTFSTSPETLKIYSMHCNQCARGLHWTFKKCWHLVTASCLPLVACSSLTPWKIAALKPPHLPSHYNQHHHHHHVLGHHQEQQNQKQCWTFSKVPPWSPTLHRSCPGGSKTLQTTLYVLQPVLNIM